MTFSEKLNEYLTEIDISTTELAKASGISTSTLTRYRNGEREPRLNNHQLKLLSAGIAAIAKEKAISLDEDEVYLNFYKILTKGLSVDYETYLDNLNTLFTKLNIKISHLAKALHFDPSHVSKILSGQRRPGDIGKFNTDIAKYIIRQPDNRQRIVIADFIEPDYLEISDAEEQCRLIIKWLETNTNSSEIKSVYHFLKRMDSFHSDKFIRSIPLNEKVTASPFGLSATKKYSGTTQLMESELDFIRATLLSKSMQDCILYSDVHLGKMSETSEFNKKWTMGMAMLLKKGLHLHIIHNINYTFSQMMSELEDNIPLYMTGQISSYYIQTSKSEVFHHVLKVSGAAFLSGHAITGFSSDARYTLSKTKEDIRFGQKNAQLLLEKALPLMDIYRCDRHQEYSALLYKLYQNGDWLMSSNSLPIYTISEELLNQLLERNHIAPHDRQRIFAYRRKYRSAVTTLLKHNHITLEVPFFSEEQFHTAPLSLSLTDIFFTPDITYTYEEYIKHYTQTKEFESSYPNLSVTGNPQPALRNVSYRILKDRLAIISVSKTPLIHFLCYHPHIVSALQHFTLMPNEEIH